MNDNFAPPSWVTDSGPVTTSIVRTILPNREGDYETWLAGITAEAVKFRGHMGVNILRPAQGSRRYVSIFRFDSFEHSQAWEQSSVRREWLNRLRGIVEGHDDVQKATGLEFWFSLPELPAVLPSPHKMALVLLVVVFVLALLINYLLTNFTEGLPSFAQILLSVFLQVMLLTYIVMPRVSQLLKSWLYANKN